MHAYICMYMYTNMYVYIQITQVHIDTWIRYIAALHMYEYQQTHEQTYMQARVCLCWDIHKDTCAIAMHTGRPGHRQLAGAGTAAAPCQAGWSRSYTEPSVCPGWVPLKCQMSHVGLGEWQCVCGQPGTTEPCSLSWMLIKECADLG